MAPLPKDLGFWFWTVPIALERRNKKSRRTEMVSFKSRE